MPLLLNAGNARQVASSRTSPTAIARYKYTYKCVGKHPENGFVKFRILQLLDVQGKMCFFFSSWIMKKIEKLVVDGLHPSLHILPTT